VLKQKLHNNAYRDENTKLKTRLAVFEAELRQRERVIDELLVKPDAIANLTSGATTSAVALATVGGNFAKMKKFESHLTQNLKRRMKEMQLVIATKSQELDTLKRNIKTTKQNEMEVELRSYMEECTRLRQQLEEVIKSKDTFADPEELKIIESRFATQEQIINGLRMENTQFLNTIASKDEEILKLRELFSDTAKRNRARSSNNKDAVKSKKLLRDKDQEIMRLTDQLRSQKYVVEDQRQKIDDILNNGRKPSGQRPSQTNNSSFQNSLSYGAPNFKSGAASSDDKLRQEV
jgi:hypothetical protein